MNFPRRRFWPQGGQVLGGNRDVGDVFEEGLGGDKGEARVRETMGAT